jgi:hypothetical protein
MATITSVGSGNWGTAGTWDTGIPADGDDVVIASGHTVTFNADQSAFTTGVKITITGTLTHTTASGNYCLFAKTGASIVGAGTWNIGTSGTPIPFASKHTVTGAAGWYVDGVAGLTMTVYGTEPTYTYIKLSGDEAIGQTELSVDTDVTGDIWAAGDIVRIDDINKAQETEERVIAAGGIAAGTITVTAGLTAAKSTGAYVCLITRNVKIIAVGTGSRTIYRVGSTANKLTISGGMWYGVNKYMFETCNYATISGGTFSGNNHSLSSCTSATISGGTFSGNISGLYTCTTPTISGGTFSGNNYGLYNCTIPTISGGTFSGNNYGLYNCTAATISGGTFSGNGYDLRQVNGRIHNVSLTSTTEHYLYTLNTFNTANCQSEDHDGVDGALKAWCQGGVVTSQTTVKPTGYTQAYIHVLESDAYPAFWCKEFSVEPGKTVSVEVQLRKDASMTYLPRVYLMASIGNPLAGATPVDTFTMTDSTDTWESDTFSITNSTAYDQDYTLWFVGQNATDNIYSAYDITTEGGGTSSVKILPLGKVGL